MMNNELAPLGPLHEQMEFAKALSAAQLLPAAFRGKPADVLLAMQYGRALGIETMAAINGIQVINGKPSLGADLCAALVRRAGHTLRVKGDQASATATIHRKDDPEYGFEATWTLDRAKTAGLTGKDSWKNYASIMLKKRAITEVARDACPEALAGIGYDPEELETPPPVRVEAVRVDTGEIIVGSEMGSS